jgi:ubiquinone biosynthesis protein
MTLNKLKRYKDIALLVLKHGDVRVRASFQKVANRIALGVVLASLIMGAALLMRIENGFRILGYPGLAMLMFIAAAGLGFALTLNIPLHDEWARRKK